jgi:amino acid permease
METSLKPLEMEGETGRKHLNIYHASMAVLSTIIGGGIVALPFCAFQLGLPLWALLNLVFMYVTYESCNLYILLHDILPGKPTSMFEIGFIAVGRKAIFANALNNLINSTCLVIIYFIVVGETCAQFFGSFFGQPLGGIWYSSKPFYVAILALLLLPVVLLRQLAEFKWLGTLMFGSVSIFLMCCLYVLSLDR